VRISPNPVAIGMSAFLKACFKKTIFSETPLARAVRM
jgi:hypothetical protein